MLEGECFQYDSKIWFVKGFQHPEGFIVAYPRYNLFTKERVGFFDSVYWSCVKQEIPLVPLSNVKQYSYSLNSSVREFVLKLFIDCSGLCENNVVVTGSTVMGVESGDLDIIVYGVDESDVEDIHKSLSACFKPINEYNLIKEYYMKHKVDTDLYTYLSLKRNTKLHYLFGNLHVNVKYVFFDKGWSNCIEPVDSFSSFKGYVEVVESIRKYAIPTLYVVKHDDEELYLWSLREIYAEIPEGIYFIEGRLEKRPNGYYIVPDKGWLSKRFLQG